MDIQDFCWIEEIDKGTNKKLATWELFENMARMEAGEVRDVVWVEMILEYYLKENF